MIKFINPYKGHRYWFFIVLLPVIGASENYKGLFTENLSDVLKTIPKRVTSKGDLLSYDVTTFNNNSSELVYFNISIDQDVHFLILNSAKNIFTSSLVIERRRKDNFTRQQPLIRGKNCHFQGFINRQKGSKVALSTCNGLTGIILTQKGKYYIEPSYHPTKKIGAKHVHLVYKRSAVVTGYRKLRKKRKRNHTTCGTKVPRRWTLLEWQYQQTKLEGQRKKRFHRTHIRTNIKKGERRKNNYVRKSIKTKKSNRKRRTTSINFYVESLVVADASMVEFHQDGDIETYILSLMNMVSLLFQDPTIGNSLKIVVVKIILLEDPNSEPILNITTNADLTLKHFCRWQTELNPDGDDHPHHHDVAILITRKDICARQDTPCGTLGVAHIGGMCTESRSCSVNEDNGISSAHTIAHELGHNFGMIHDSEKIGCKRREGNSVHIMTPNFEADTVSVNWSNCSRRAITRFLDKGLGQCLEDEPTELEEYKYPDLPAGVMYDAFYQCRLQFGNKSTLCTSLDEMCLHLWCTVNDTCTTLLRPAAEGTTCGKHKWCHNRECVLMLESPTPIDGDWGEWSSWSECSRTCGGGVSLMTRECNHPTPAHGGKYCIGERTRSRMCNTNPCHFGEPSFRAAQCSKYNDELHEGKKYEWQPYFDTGDPCQLYCSDSNETVIVPRGEYAQDGTPCSIVSRDICIAGVCKKVGCDWVVESKAEEDDCGICQGDGSKCDKKHGINNKQNRSPGYREIVVVPKGARNIRIEEKGYSGNYLSIGSAFAKKFFLNGDRHIFTPGEYIIAGTRAFYGRENQLEKVHIPGPILEPIVVYQNEPGAGANAEGEPGANAEVGVVQNIGGEEPEVLEAQQRLNRIFFKGNTWNPGVEYKYSIWKQEATNKIKYMWILDEWSQCSTTCGGGLQFRKPLCQESVLSIAPELERPTMVDEYYCEPREKPDEVVRSCSEENCPSRWWVGPWQACAASCLGKGQTTIKRRSVVCVDKKEMALPDDYCDKKAKPFEFEQCLSLPFCDDV